MVPLVKYCAKMPKEVDFDFNCQAKEFIDNREPALFAKTRMKLEPVHGIKHKCGKQFKHSRGFLENKNLNLSLAESDGLVG